jgi:hypothetical protein
MSTQTPIVQGPKTQVQTEQSRDIRMLKKALENAQNRADEACPKKCLTLREKIKRFATHPLMKTFLTAYVIKAIQLFIGALSWKLAALATEAKIRAAKGKPVVDLAYMLRMWVGIEAAFNVFLWAVLGAIYMYGQSNTVPVAEFLNSLSISVIVIDWIVATLAILIVTSIFAHKLQYRRVFAYGKEEETKVLVDGALVPRLELQTGPNAVAIGETLHSLGWQVTVGARLLPWFVVPLLLWTVTTSD